MKIRVYLINGEVLDFHERGENAAKFDEAYKDAISNKRLIILPCTNGDFLINPSQISYIRVTSDNPFEVDQQTYKD